MEGFKGTPGEWKWFTSNSHKRLSSVLSGKDGDVLYAYNDSTGFPMVGCTEKDMALIAAAPELLEALQELLALYEHDEGCREITEYKRAKAALSKALGQ
ncbi:hypothetical protein [Pantoea sp.]|uniref:hypothetical protein n=1 Tax=Pantoea sp. TaxID=69393 RepID=UPI0028A293E0|nr:hypothetical protein [Pantoea sp.]